MSRARQRRYLMRLQRYERRCLLLNACPSSSTPMWGEVMYRSYRAVERQVEGRWWRRPFVLHGPHQGRTS